MAKARKTPEFTDVDVTIQYTVLVTRRVRIPTAIANDLVQLADWVAGLDTYPWQSSISPDMAEYEALTVEGLDGNELLDTGR